MEPKEVDETETAEDTTSSASGQASSSKAAAASEPSVSKTAGTAGATVTPATLENELPEVPKEEPTATATGAEREPEVKKLKSTHDPEADTDDDWEKIEKPSVPRHATVEDAEDEDVKKAKV